MRFAICDLRSYGSISRLGTVNLTVNLHSNISRTSLSLSSPPPPLFYFFAQTASHDHYQLKSGSPVDYCLVVRTDNKFYAGAAELRSKYLDELRSKFQLEIDCEKSADGIWECYKISASFDRLLHEADRMNLKLSIKVRQQRTFLNVFFFFFFFFNVIAVQPC